MAKKTLNTGEGKTQIEMFRESQKDHRKMLKNHNDHVVKGEKEYKKSWCTAIISLVVGVLSLLCAALSFLGVNAVRKAIHVSVGMTPFHVNDRSDLVGRYQSHLRPINYDLNESGILNKRNITLEIALADSYEAIIDGLKEDKNIQMAFVSQYLYHKNMKGKRENDALKLIGFKTMDGAHYYKSVVIWNRGRFDAKVDITTIVEKLKSGAGVFYLGPGESVSTHIVPELFLAGNGYDAIIDHDDSLKKSRTDIVKLIENNNKGAIIFGALSDEDYMRLDPDLRKKIDTLGIDVDIPYDAVLVNRKWWDRELEPRFKKRIMKAMSFDNDETKVTMGLVGYCGRKDNKFDSLYNVADGFRKYLSAGIFIDGTRARIPQDTLISLGFDTTKDTIDVTVHRSVKGGRIDSLGVRAKLVKTKNEEKKCIYRLSDETGRTFEKGYRILPASPAATSGDKATPTDSPHRRR